MKNILDLKEVKIFENKRTGQRTIILPKKKMKKLGVLPSKVSVRVRW